jgi:DNA-binding LacI/PurR family transcriptional regulator
MTSAREESGRVGVRDVARVAGVSTQTVSRVINDQPHIRAETRRRVEDAMAQLGYRVNNAARALGTSRTRTLGVIASDATLYGPAYAIAALAAAAREQGRWVATAYAEAGDPASVDDALAHVLGQGVDGVVVVAPHTRTLSRLTDRAGGVPIVAMHDGPGAIRQSEGARLAAAHLASLGHTRIARLGGPEDWIEELARAAGHRAGLEAAGLEAGPHWTGDWSAGDASARAGEIASAIRAPGGPTAIAVANDQMALGLMAGLAALDVDVPGDVSITGYDDNPDAAYYRPALTTVRLDIAGEARRCAATAMGEDAAEDPGAPELVLRASTAPPPR